MSPLFGFSFLRKSHQSAEATAVRTRRLRRKVTSDAQLLEAWNTPSLIAPVGDEATGTSLETMDVSDLGGADLGDAPPDEWGWSETDASTLEDATDDATAADDPTATDDPSVTDDGMEVMADVPEDATDDASDDASGDGADDASGVMDGGAIADPVTEEEVDYITSEDEVSETRAETEFDVATPAEATDPESPEMVDTATENAEALDGDPTSGSEETVTDTSENTDTSESEAETDETGLTNSSDEEAADEELEDGAVASAIADAEPQFKSGIFTVGESGEVGIDWLWDGGKYRGEAGIFSLSGLEEFEVGSEDFIREVTTRVLSSSESGHVVLSDHTDAARFDGKLDYEGDFNSGEYRGVRTFAMQAGDTFGIAIVPDGKFATLLNNPGAEGKLRPLFSMVTFNPR
jgi:hypothetical protein